MDKCFFVDDLPRDFNTDFRAWIRYEILANAAKTDEERRKVQQYAETVLAGGNPIGEERLQAFIRFFRCGETQIETDNKLNQAFGNSARAYDFAVDGPLIYAAFWQAYGIDLNNVELHWWEFMALFRGLPETCRICQIMEYRTADTSKMPKETKAQYDKLRRAYALPETSGGERRYASFADRKAAAIARHNALDHKPRNGQ